MEAILKIENSHGAARVTDIANELGLSKGSVSGALKKLRDLKFINYWPYHPVTLTRMGRQIAENVSWRNRVLFRFMTEVLLMDKPSSYQAAKCLGHVVEDTVVEYMRRFMAKMSQMNDSSVPEGSERQVKSITKKRVEPR
ncbi:putative iron-dependent repressor, DtxR family [Desulfosarcina variabilis str. Montpellier]